MILVVDRKNTTIRYQNGTIRLERENQPARNIAINQLEHVVVYGNPLVEASVWRALSHAGVPATLLALRGKMADAVIGAGLATQLPFRRLQHQLASNPATSIVVARYIVQQKLRGYALPLSTLVNLYDLSAEHQSEFENLLEQLQIKLSNASCTASLMGLEGQAAQAWFVLLAKYLPFRWKFAGRNRRPPRDPVNALLSLGYTLAMSDIRHGIVSNGLDPALGFLHHDYPGRDSMVLDLTEIFRSAIDHFSLNLLSSGTLDDTSFYFREKEGCRLSKSARPAFYQAWGNYRYRWPRPFQDGLGEADDINSEGWPTASLTEVINGQVMQFRGFMKQLDINPIALA